VLVGDRIDIREVVQFQTNSAEILPVSFPLLTQVATVMADHPELLKVRVEGHTDSRGPDAYNLALSQRRADSVRAFLVQHGVAPERLDAMGYGETRPVDPREVPEAWEKNRRVQLTVTQRSD
jgi:outer membrane protein OmpA-like peptidoglycan-associated protein